MFSPDPTSCGGTVINFSQGQTNMPGHCLGYSALWLIRHARNAPFSTQALGAFAALDTDGVAMVKHLQGLEDEYDGPRRELMIATVLGNEGLLIHNANSKTVKTDPVAIWNEVSKGGLKLLGMLGEEQDWNAQWDSEYTAHAVVCDFDRDADTFTYFDPNYGEVTFPNVAANEAKIMVWFLEYLQQSLYAETFTMGTTVESLSPAPSFTVRHDIRVENILTGLERGNTMLGEHSLREQAEQLADRSPGLRYRGR
jgi:hypothetical protein